MNKLRTHAIINYVEKLKYCSSRDLAKAFGVSPATIQRDITEIVEQKALRKVHGGVASLDVFDTLHKTAEAPACRHFNERINLFPQEKAKIAEQAEPLVKDGDVIFLDSSTTTIYLARRLQRSTLSNLTIITNSALLIQEFCLFPTHFILIPVAGIYNFELNSFLGRRAIENLRQYRINSMFFSATGLSKDGAFTPHEGHLELIKQAMDVSQEAHLLLDGSKFNKTSVFQICPTERIHSLVSNVPPPAEIAQRINTYNRPA